MAAVRHIGFRRAGRPSPLIELSNMWADCETNFGQVRDAGLEIRFHAASFEVLPDEIGGSIIAHELAHVFQKALGMRPGGDNESDNETDADRITGEWGFDLGVLKFLKTMDGDVSLREKCEFLEKAGLINRPVCQTLVMLPAGGRDGA